MKLAGGAGIALAFASGCGGSPVRKFIPYVDPPQYPPAGEWVMYATVCRECPAGCGMHLMHRDGRATKAEGNPLHPLNTGRLCARGQSSLQGVYDPDRIKNVIHQKRGVSAEPGTWNSALADIGARIARRGTRVILISDLQTGTLAEIFDAFASALGEDSLTVYFEPFNYEALRNADRMLFGRDVIPRFGLDHADYIVSFGADFLETWISPIEFTRRFRSLHTYKGSIGKAAFVGPRQNLTACNADVYVQTAAGEEGVVAFAVLKKIIESGGAKTDMHHLLPQIDAIISGRRVPVEDGTIELIASDFMHAESGVALAGNQTSAAAEDEMTAAAAMLLNVSMGRIGREVRFDEPHALSRCIRREDFEKILSGINENDVIIISGANPAYAHPSSLGHLKRAGQIVAIGTMEDETASIADWVLPAHSPIESWGDYEPYPGIEGTMQPGMQPLYPTLQTGDILIALAEAAGRPLRRPASGTIHTTFDAWFRERWGARESGGRDAIDERMNATLQSGGSWNERQNSEPIALLSTISLTPASENARGPGQLTLYCWPSIMLFDGRLSNRSWIQEIPEPASFISWNSYIEMHPVRAAKEGVETGDVIEIELAENKKLEAPVFVTESVHEHVITLAFGQGHTTMGDNAKERGINAFTMISSSKFLAYLPVMQIKKTGWKRKPAMMAAGTAQWGRQVLEWMDLSSLRTIRPGDVKDLVLPLPEGYQPDRDLYPPLKYSMHRWAMAIDLQACIGCGACTAACYAENNISTVGEKQAAKGREHSWIKVVPYRDEKDHRRLGWIPMLCQHCDAAPCEPVCPVFAAVHNEEGLNAQIYNRCIGTRYCSNNCPYKVRVFNWFDPEFQHPLEVQLNPEVTVRSRGVMEKCTFCVQRIRNAEYHASIDRRELKDGDIVTACQQTCPADAIVFGDLLDDASRVSRLTRHDPRRYHVLEELNTKPAVTYLKRIANDEPPSAGL